MDDYLINGRQESSVGPHPIVSTGTIDLVSECFFYVTIVWNGKKETRLLGPNDLASLRERIDNPRMRLYVAGYLVLRDGNRCAIRSPFCIQGDSPFEHPEHADFDHIDPTRGPNGMRNHQLKNLRLACPRCDTHLQWKQKAATTSEQIRERESGAKAYSGEIDLNVRLYPRYQRWLDEESKKANGIPLDEAINRASREIHAEIGHGAHQTIRGYLGVLTSGDDSPYWIDSEKKLVHRRAKRE